MTALVPLLHALPLAAVLAVSPDAAIGALVGAAVAAVIAVGVGVVLYRRMRDRIDTLLASEQHHHALLERASDAVFVHDVNGGCLEINREARTLIGLGDDGPVPAFLDVIVPEDRTLAVQHLRELRATGNARTDLRVVENGGAGPLLEFESQVVDTGDGVHVISLGRDVGARRAHEQALVAAREEAEETARAKSSFLASMSHEIRTPLTAVIGFADLLMDEVDPEARGLVDAIQAGGRRLLATLNSVLDLARLDAQGEALRRVPFDVVEHVRQSVTLLQGLVQERGLTLTVSAPPAPVVAELDPDALDRIVTNLVGNAAKFTEDGGITVEIDADDHTVSIRVIDTGIGIAEDFLDDLFVEFRQQSEGHGRSHEGTGLGLAITKRLVDLQGGTISVDSQWNVGTAFTVALPRTAAGGDGQAHMPELMVAA